MPVIFSFDSKCRYLTIAKCTTFVLRACAPDIRSANMVSAAWAADKMLIS